jgi:hypothetical protein
MSSDAHSIALAQWTLIAACLGGCTNGDTGSGPPSSMDASDVSQGTREASDVSPPTPDAADASSREATMRRREPSSTVALTSSTPAMRTPSATRCWINAHRPFLTRVPATPNPNWLVTMGSTDGCCRTIRPATTGGHPASRDNGNSLTTTRAAPSADGGRTTVALLTNAPQKVESVSIRPSTTAPPDSSTHTFPASPTRRTTAVRLWCSATREHRLTSACDGSAYFTVSRAV